MLLAAEVGKGGLDLRTNADITQFLSQAVNDDGEEHIAGGLGRFAVERGFAVGAEPFAQFLADGGEAVEGDVLQEFHFGLGEVVC